MLRAQPRLGFSSAATAARTHCVEIITFEDKIVVYVDVLSLSLWCLGLALVTRVRFFLVDRVIRPFISAFFAPGRSLAPPISVFFGWRRLLGFSRGRLRFCRARLFRFRFSSLSFGRFVSRSPCCGSFGSSSLFCFSLLLFYRQLLFFRRRIDRAAFNVGTFFTDFHIDHLATAGVRGRLQRSDCLAFEGDFFRGSRRSIAITMHATQEYQQGILIFIGDQFICLCVGQPSLFDLGQQFVHRYAYHFGEFTNRYICHAYTPVKLLMP